MSTQQINIRPDGTIEFIWSDDLVDFGDLGAMTINRASHVEPAPGTPGTPGTSGGWIADLAPRGGPKLGPFRLRGEALAAEIDWLKANL